MSTKLLLGWLCFFFNLLIVVLGLSKAFSHTPCTPPTHTHLKVLGLFHISDSPNNHSWLSIKVEGWASGFRILVAQCKLKTSEANDLAEIRTQKTLELQPQFIGTIHITVRQFALTSYTWFQQTAVSEKLPSVSETFSKISEKKSTLYMYDLLSHLSNDVSQVDKAITRTHLKLKVQWQERETRVLFFSRKKKQNYWTDYFPTFKKSTQLNLKLCTVKYFLKVSYYQIN